MRRPAPAPSCRPRADLPASEPAGSSTYRCPADTSGRRRLPPPHQPWGHPREYREPGRTVRAGRRRRLTSWPPSPSRGARRRLRGRWSPALPPLVLALVGGVTYAVGCAVRRRSAAGRRAARPERSACSSARPRPVGGAEDRRLPVPPQVPGAARQGAAGRRRARDRCSTPVAEGVGWSRRRLRHGRRALARQAAGGRGVPAAADATRSRAVGGGGAAGDRRRTRREAGLKKLVTGRASAPTAAAPRSAGPSPATTRCWRRAR